MPEKKSLLCKIRSALLKGESLKTLLTPEQYKGYLELESIRASAAANHDPSSSKPLPSILGMLPPPPNPKKRLKTGQVKSCPDINPRPLPKEYQELLLDKGVDLDEGNLKLIFIKMLFKTDCSDHHGRLSMPHLQVREEFLTVDEEKLMRGEDGIGEKMSVRVFEPSMEEQMMHLAMWNREKSTSWLFALNNDWNQLVEENNLVTGDVIQVWSFRIKGKLGFLIHKNESSKTDDDYDVEEETESSDGSSSSGDVGIDRMMNWSIKKKKRGWPWNV